MIYRLGENRQAFVGFPGVGPLDRGGDGTPFYLAITGHPESTVIRANGSAVM